MPIVKLGVPSSWMKMHTDIYLDEMHVCVYTGML